MQDFKIDPAAFALEQENVLRDLAKLNAPKPHNNTNPDAVQRLYLALGPGSGLPRETAALLANCIAKLQADIAELKAAMQLPHMAGVEKRTAKK